jgi:hypothetical protein
MLTTEKFRPTPEDLLRSAGYLTILVWSILYTMFPPLAVTNSLDTFTRYIWMGATCMGASIALLGSVLRIDLKMELPGVLIALIGPILYSASQMYFVAFPLAGDHAGSRIAFIVYSMLPAILLLPRSHELYAESKRLHRINKTLGTTE